VAFLSLSGCTPRDSAEGQPTAATTSQPSPKVGESSAAQNGLSSEQLEKDDLGRTINLAKVPQRIVSIGPGATEIIYALGFESKLVGRDSSSDFPVEATKVASVADFRGPFLESVIVAKPDFMIVQGETWGRDRIEEWQKKIGVPVAALSATTVEGVAQGIERLGYWVGGETDTGLKLANSLRTKSSPGASGQKPLRKALFEIQRSPLMVAGRGTLVDDVMGAAGLANAGGSVEGYKQFNMESLLADQPDYYVVTTSARGRNNGYPTSEQLRAEAAKVRAELAGMRGLRELECVKADRILVIPADWALRPGPRLRLAIDELARQIVSKKQ
jgi:iron complex transport system substrate-binding protein